MRSRGNRAGFDRVARWLWRRNRRKSRPKWWRLFAGCRRCKDRHRRRSATTLLRSITSPTPRSGRTFNSLWSVAWLMAFFSVWRGNVRLYRAIRPELLRTTVGQELKKWKKRIWHWNWIVECLRDLKDLEEDLVSFETYFFYTKTVIISSYNVGIVRS